MIKQQKQFYLNLRPDDPEGGREKRRKLPLTRDKKKSQVAATFALSI